MLLVAFSQSLGVAHEYADKHDYEIEANTELGAYAVVNVFAGMFGGQVAGGSLAPSATNDGAGGRSQMAQVVAWVAVVLTLLFLTPVFANLPETILAALILHALWHIIQSRKLHRVRLLSRTEFVLGLLTFLGVILLDVLPGMLIGLGSTLLVIILHSSKPHVSSLGRVPEAPGAYSDVVRHPEAVAVSGLLILRPDAPLYYANVLTVRDRIAEMLSETDPAPAAVLLDFASQYSLDITSADLLTNLIEKLHKKGISVYLAEMHRPVREFAAKTGLLDVIGEENLFPTVDAAVRQFEATQRGGM